MIAVAAVVFFMASRARATTYYVSAAGSDSNAGTSEVAAWQTITKVNAANLVGGDHVLFRRGDTFEGTLTPHNSGTTGNPITFDAYGSGDAPIVSALTTLSGWTSVGANLYEATLPGARDALMVVVIDGATQQIGRYPRATADNGGYLTFESHTGATRVSDVDLGGLPSFVGGQIVLRVNHWVIDRGVVTAQTASSVDFTAPVNTSSYEFENGYGYFFQNHIATLTAQGDWAYDAARHVVTIYSTAPPVGVRASVRDSALYVVSLHDLQFQNLAFEGGSTRTINVSNGSNIGVADCEVAFSGTHGVYFSGTTSVTFERNHVHDSLSNGAQFSGGSASGIIARSNLIVDSGIRPGMGDATLATTHVGLLVNIGRDATVEYNTVRNSGYNGLSFDGDDIRIRNNIVDRFGSVKDDCGGIYSWHGSVPLSLNTGRVIDGNIVFNGITAPAGTAEGVSGGSASGIYMDFYAGGVAITNNTVYSVPYGRGIILNNSRNVTITGNTLYGAETGIAMTHWLFSEGPLLSGIVIQDNVIFPTDSSGKILRYFDWGLDVPMTATLVDRLHGLGTINENFYGSLNATPFYTPYYPVSTGPAVLPDLLSLDGWRALTGFDTTSRPVTPLASYTIDSEVATNRVSNGTFDTSVSGVGSYSANSGHRLVYDNTSKLTGTGSLRLEITTATPRAGTALLFPLGALDATKQYIVRFSTLGTTASGTVDVYIRRTVSPWEPISDDITQVFGTERVEHEVLIEHPLGVDGTLAIAFPQSAGTVYLDDVEVHEVAATTRDPLSTVYFITNSSNAAVTRAFEGTAVDARGGSHSGSIEVPPFASVILIGDGVSSGHGELDGGVSDAGFPVLDSGVARDLGIARDAGIVPGVDGGEGAFTDGAVVVGPGEVALTSTCSCDIASPTRSSAPLAFMAAMVACAVAMRRRFKR